MPIHLAAANIGTIQFFNLIFFNLLMGYIVTLTLAKSRHLYTHISICISKNVCETPNVDYKITTFLVFAKYTKILQFTSKVNALLYTTTTTNIGHTHAYALAHIDRRPERETFIIICIFDMDLNVCCSEQQYSERMFLFLLRTSRSCHAES